MSSKIISAVFLLTALIGRGQSKVYMNNYKKLTLDEAKNLISEKKGILNESASLLPSVEIYELNDNSAVVLNNAGNRATFYASKSDVIKTGADRRPKDLIEKYQTELKEFPGNKDFLLIQLGNKLKIEIRPHNHDKAYLDSISVAVKGFPKEMVNDSLYLGLLVLMGETVIGLNGGSWDVKTVNFPLPDLRKPVLLNNDGVENQFVAKMVEDSLERLSSFDWYLMVRFWMDSNKIKSATDK